MRRLIIITTVVTVALLAIPSIAIAQVPRSLVAGDVEKVAGGGKFTEGPAWHPEGFLLYSDIPNRRVQKLTPDGEVTTWWSDTGRSNGLVVTDDGTVFACQTEVGVSRLTNPALPPRYLTTIYKGVAYNGPNDLVLDGMGGLYFTDPKYGKGEQTQPVQGVYYISESGRVTRVIDDLEKPNGIVISPQRDRLFVADADATTIYSYAVKGQGKLGQKEVFFQADRSIDGNHGPDGMTFDEQGNLYASFNSIVVIAQNKNVLGRIETPEKPANCTFGGADRRSLYITARKSVYRVPMTVAGIAPASTGPKGPMVSYVAFEDESTAAEEITETVELDALTLAVPKKWNKMPLANRLRSAQYAIPSANAGQEGGEYVVFSPMGGSDVDNISRWINQFSPEGREVTITKGKSSEGEYILTDLSGTYNKSIGPPIMRKTQAMSDYRVLAAIVKTEQGNYFIKAFGPKAVIAGAIEDFRGTFGADVSTESKYEMP